MTTAAVYGGLWTFENYGPVTTTFTPAPSCTATDRLSLAAIYGDITQVQYRVACPTSTSDWDCLPPGTTTSATWFDEKKWIASDGYYSPGLHCPLDWKTIGIAERDDETLSTSGYLVTPETEEPSWQQPATLLASALEPSQTMVLCCPSSMTPDGLGQCTALVPSYKPTVGCDVYVDNDYVWETLTWTHVYSGTTMTNTYPVNSFVSASTSTSSTTFPVAAERFLTAVSFAPIITMIHHQSDMDAAGITKHQVQANSTATGTTGSTGPLRLGLKASTWDGFGAVLGGSAVAMALGVVMIIL
ncbi:uncharacterized protein N7477_005914 [Penicillium maclennaniae]|uniref:uncharacterized protein n=1 Tax=Penicillium maclennaniae TaxID=1343394 RepID=UPI0025417C87|nr:uncharacterized protein N7477_005914 [Penicillium maclennaniae]KAJ5670551.1 hypothetical protein N7477_005914 [Penicillium maclennaniae]